MTVLAAPRRLGFDLGLMGIGLAVLYAPLVPELVRDWMGSGDFSHGFAVPFVSAWLLWTRRDRLRRETVRPYLPGALLLLAAAGQYFLGVAAVEFFLQRSSAVLFLGGWILLLFGPGVARQCVFPVAILLFAIPPPQMVMNWVAFPLQLQASRVTELLLDVVGIPAVRSGNVIHLDGISLEVARACSGLRSLVTLMALGAIIAEGSLLPPGTGPRHPALRVLTFLAVIPVAIAVNSLRVAGTAVLAARAGLVLVEGFWHELAGFLMFAVSLVVLLSWRRFLRWLESSRSASRPAS